MLDTFDTLPTIYKHADFPRELFAVGPSSNYSGQELHIPSCTSIHGDDTRDDEALLWFGNCGCLAYSDPDAPQRPLAYALQAATIIDQFVPTLNDARAAMMRLNPHSLNLYATLRDETGDIRKAAQTLNSWDGTSHIDTDMRALHDTAGTRPQWVDQFVIERHQELQRTFREAADAVDWHGLWLRLAGSDHPTRDSLVAMARSSVGRLPVNAPVDAPHLLRTMMPASRVVAEADGFVAMVVPSMAADHFPWRTAAVAPIVGEGWSPAAVRVALCGLKSGTAGSFTELLDAATAAIG